MSLATQYDVTTTIEESFTGPKGVNFVFSNPSRQGANEEYYPKTFT